MTRQAQIFVGLAAGAAAGLGARLEPSGTVARAVLALEPIGTAFIRLVTMVIVPLVVASLFVATAGIGDVRRLGRIGGRTLLYFLATTLSAAVVGVVVAIVGRVDASVAPAARAALFTPNASATVAGAAANISFVQTLLAFVPQNPFAVAAQGDLLPLIVAVLIFAAAATAIAADRRRSLVSFFEGVNDVSMVVIGWVMRLAPVGVAALVGAMVARGGGGVLGALAWYALIVVIALAVHVTLVLMPILRLSAARGVVGFVRDVSDALLLAFSTASSSATLPVSMAAARQRLRIPDEITSFVLPLGTTLNKNGAAVYKAVTAVFLAQLFLLPLDAGRLLTIVLASTVASFAGAGVPGSSLVTTLIVLNAMGLGANAAAGIALVTGIDRPLDMCRTTVNTVGNLVGAAWVARRAAPSVDARLRPPVAAVP